MIIGIDASRVNKKERSGVEWYSYHLLKQLFKLDDKNSYFLYTLNPLTDDLKPLPKNFKEKVLPWLFKRFWTQGRLSWEIFLNKPDILLVPAYIFPLFLGKKNVIVWMDLGHRHFPECYTKGQLKLIEYGLKRAAKVADKIITISEFSKQELINYYNIEPSRIVVIYLGYEEKVFYPRKELDIQSIKSKYQLKNSYLLFVGRLTKRKNLENLVEAYNIVRQNYHQKIDLALVGGQDFGYQSILDKINQSPYQASIKVLGYVLEEDLPALFSGASCLVHPSLFEGFGMTILEAMACGCPVVCSNVGSLAEIGQDAVLYFDPQNPKEIAQKILSVLSDGSVCSGSREFTPRLREELIQKGLKRVENFSWEKCTQETLEVFKFLR
jgi:glycosyltransferase involved in cell wall biosynthesis